MRRIGLMVALVLVGGLLAGCGAHLHDPDNPNAGLIFGYIDMDEAPTDLDYVTFRQYKPKPKDDKPFWVTSGVDGMFWYDQWVPGSYQLAAFGGSSWWRNASFHYNMPDYGKNETAITFTKSGLYYVGSYKYKDVGSFFNPKFELERVKKPTELELLQMMLPYSEGTVWQERIKKRLGELQ